MLDTEPNTEPNTDSNTDSNSVTNPDTLACPQCKQDVYRIRRKIYQRLFFGSQRFYCEFCKHAFLKWRKLVKEK